MDKHALSYYLLDNIENDEFLQRKYKELLIAYSKSLFSEYSENMLMSIGSCFAMRI